MAYQATLKSHLLPFSKVLYDQYWLFHQHTASVLTSKSRNIWLAVKNITILYWPSLSLDFNPIEHVWDILTNTAYLDELQYFFLRLKRQ